MKLSAMSNTHILSKLKPGRIALVGFAALYSLSIAVSFAFGGEIRDALSAKVEVVSPTFYLYDDGYITMAGVSNECIYTDGDTEWAYIAEESSDSGESAYYARRVTVKTGKDDGICAELLYSQKMDAMYICAESEPRDGDRVVIEGVKNTP